MRPAHAHWGRMALHLLLAVVGAAFVVEPFLTLADGADAPAWAHLWCSPAALRSAAHAVGASGGFGATLLTALEVHWPHFLPILLGVATLVYLWRANGQYHASRGLADAHGR